MPVANVATAASAAIPFLVFPIVIDSPYRYGKRESFQSRHAHIEIAQLLQTFKNVYVTIFKHFHSIIQLRKPPNTNDEVRA